MQVFKAQATPSLDRRRVLGGLLAVAVSRAGAEEVYPSKPIRMAVPFPPGGSPDLVARALAEQLRKELGVAVVVENRVGASGVVGTQWALRAAPDGYNLVFGTLNSQISAPLLMAKPPYDGARDATPLALVMSVPGVLLIPAGLPIKSFDEFVRYVKQRPGQLSYGSSGVGSNNHLLIEMLKVRTGMELTHVPYRGTADAQQGLVRGEVALLLDSPLSARNWLQQARVRALAVTASRSLPTLPEVPSLVELGVLERSQPFWMGLLAPPDLSPAIANRILQATTRALASAEMAELAASSGGEVGSIVSGKFADFLRDEQRTWGDLIRRNHLQAN